MTHVPVLPAATTDAHPGTDPGTDPGAQPELPDLVHFVSHGLRRSWMADLSPFGISPHQWRALHTIVAHDGAPQRQRDVASQLRIAARSAAEVIGQLESEGWITRTPDPSDKRAVLLTATDAGREIEGRVSQMRAQRGSEYFATLGAQDHAELKRLLSLLVEAHPRQAAAGPATDRPAPAGGQAGTA
ncbi:MarR family winged helix-turn-helix transcriptional regulator [Galactobacter caseinivorans]|uniref:MarR family transcriptional regulator n=1 Tax=Galactobacter caseinivorans TaxID=2676123 RepID=A0A496PI89_9MICC|nr:MarR family winged helix-turn-helix transcriptional regulator [Galactobacter caseinivorans]RKW70197.1 MarR family transcriptional regulator [Galactobacter caseinivorans]